MKSYEKYQILMYLLWRLQKRCNPSSPKHLSNDSLVHQLVQLKHTVAPEISSNPIHTNVIRGPLTRNLGLLFPDVVDEIERAFPEAIPLKDDGERYKIQILQLLTNSYHVYGRSLD